MVSPQLSTSNQPAWVGTWKSTEKTMREKRPPATAPTGTSMVLYSVVTG